MLCAVSVFAGGWTAPAAAAVARLDLTTAWRLLGGLLDASMIVRTTDTRFALLETVRVFAVARAAASGVLTEAKERHAVHIESFVAAARQGVGGPDHDEWFDRLRWERDNLRAALRWRLEQGELDRCAAILDLPTYWIMVGHVAEYRQWADEVLAGNDDSLSPRARAGVLAVYGYASHGGDSEHAIRVADQAVGLARLDADPPTLAMALLFRGHVARSAADNELAEALFDEAEAALRQVGRPAVTRAVQAQVTMVLDQRREADQALAELEVEVRKAGATWGLASTLVHRGSVLIQLGEWQRSERLVREAVRIMSRLGSGSGSGMTWALHQLSITAANTGQPERSARLAGAAARLMEHGGPSTIADNVRRSRRPAAGTAGAELGRDTFDRLFGEGRAMTLGQAVALAVSTPRPAMDPAHFVHSGLPRSRAGDRL